ncbi:MAG: hypothetical protein JKY53_01730 [Flavobacteriales bacterium]|nr:hypothetical protein [Flavobacteriales bacterium]
MKIETVLHVNLTVVTRLVREFEQAVLPRSGWTHQAHLLVATVYCYTNKSEQEAFDKVKITPS